MINLLIGMSEHPKRADESAVICINLRKLPPPLVMLSAAKDLVRWAEMLRCTQHDNAAMPTASYACHPGRRDASLRPA